MAHQMLKPYSFLLYFLAILTFFFVGLTYAGIIEAGKNQGLAGGAIVLGYGVMGAFFGFLMALFLANKTNRKIIFRLNIILAILCVGFYSYYHLKYLERQKAKALEKQHIELPKKPIPTKPVVPEAEPMAMLVPNGFKKNVFNQENEDGLGMFKPNFGEQQVLYFYGNPYLGKALIEHTPYDSITFQKKEYGGYSIATAPPWLVPDHLKLDYDLLYFKVQSVTQEFVEVTVNTLTEQTAFVSKYDGAIAYWPEFLLSVHSVEFPNPETETIYVKPLEYAGKVDIAYSFMKPLRISNEWMFVELQDDDFKSLGTGWIKWIADGKLLVQYALLS
jgi:hypothetical protein